MEFKRSFENGAVSKSPLSNKQEDPMLKKFAAALVATTLIAAPALAAQSGAAATPAVPATQATPAAPAASNAKQIVAPGETHKQTRVQTRKHVAHGKSRSHQANVNGAAKRS
jgi:hypothetical protein